MKIEAKPQAKGKKTPSPPEATIAGLVPGDLEIAPYTTIHLRANFRQEAPHMHHIYKTATNRYIMSEWG